MTLSLNQNPEDRFPKDILEKESDEKRWYVAHCKSRREKALAHYLIERNIGYYLPMMRRQQSSNKRERFSLVPVFSGYLFFRADGEERLQALRSKHIARVIEVGDEKKFIGEIRQVDKVLSGGFKIYPYDFIREGELVEVKRGFLKGLKGRIIRKATGCKLILSIESIMQAVSVSIDADAVERITR